MATVNAVGNGLTGASGTGNFVGATAPTLSNVTVGNMNLNTNTISTTSGDLTFQPTSGLITQSQTLNSIMQFRNTNLSTGTGASAGFGMFNSANSFGINLYSTGYTGVSGWANYGVLLTSNGANGIRLVATNNKVIYLSTTGTDTKDLYIDGSGNVSTEVGTFTPNQTKGIVGTTTNNDAQAGSVGQLISSTIVAASAVSLTTATPANLTSISLTAGDWDVWGNVTFIPAATTNVVQARGWISSTSATQPDASLYSGIQHPAAGEVPADNFGFNVPARRLSLSGTTTVYISVTQAFTVDTLTVCGGIYARRRR